MPPRAQFRDSLEALRVDVDVVGRMAADALRAALGALVADDRSSALQVVAGDDRIDTLFVALEERAYALIAREAPVATDLRFLMSALRVMSDFEKIGDRAVAIAKSALAEWPREGAVLTLLGRMGDVALQLLGDARQAWLEPDLYIAADLKRRDSEVDACYRRLMSYLLAQDGEGATVLLLHGHTTGRNLERISDHAVMIAERVSYLVTGDPSALAAEVR